MTGYEPANPAAAASVNARMAAGHTLLDRHAAIAMGALGVVSGLLSSFLPGPVLGADLLPANVALYMVLAGVWFGLVVGFGVFSFANRTGSAVAGTLLGTWVAWEVAANVAIQLDDNWLKLAGLPEPTRTYITGFVAGEVGALITWAAAASFSPRLREPRAAIAIGTTGALFGLLLPLSILHETQVLLFVPWQAAVAAAFGWFLARPAGDA